MQSMGALECMAAASEKNAAPAEEDDSEDYVPKGKAAAPKGKGKKQGAVKQVCSCRQVFWHACVRVSGPVSGNIP